MDEIISIFEQNFELTEDGEYQLLVSDLTKFFSEKISGLYVERLMVDMDKKGLATLGHDGNDIVLIKKERYWLLKNFRYTKTRKGNESNR